MGDSCPYGDELNGGTMEIERPFVTNGQSLGAGRGEPLVVGTEIRSMTSCWTRFRFSRMRHRARNLNQVPPPVTLPRHPPRLG